MAKKVSFLRQVDYFSISARTATIVNEIIDEINSEMTIDIEPPRSINRFNGVDIQQTQYFFKVYNKPHID